MKYFTAVVVFLSSLLGVLIFSTVYASPPPPNSGCPGQTDYFNALQFDYQQDQGTVKIVMCGNNNLYLEGGYTSPNDWDVEAIWAKCPDGTNDICGYKLGEGVYSQWKIWKSPDTPMGYYLLSGSARCDVTKPCGWTYSSTYSKKSYDWKVQEVGYHLLRMNVTHHYGQDYIGNTWVPFNQPSDNPQNYYQNCNDLDYDGIILFDRDSCKGVYRAYGYAVSAVADTGFVPDSFYASNGWSALFSDGQGNWYCASHSHWDFDVDSFPGTAKKLQFHVKGFDSFHDDTCGGRDLNKDGAVDNNTLPPPVPPQHLELPIPHADPGSVGETAKLYSVSNFDEGKVAATFRPGNWLVNSGLYYSLRIPSGWKVTLFTADSSRNKCFDQSVANLQDFEEWHREIGWVAVEENSRCQTAAPPAPTCPTIDAPYTIGPVGTLVNEDNTVTYQWSQVEASTYYLEVATDSSFNNKVISTQTAKPPLGYGYGYTKGQQYYWRVKAELTKDGCQVQSGWSDTSQFTLAAPPQETCYDLTPPSVLWPPAEYENPEAPILFWTSGLTAKYRYQVAQDAAFTNLVIDEETNKIVIDLSVLDWQAGKKFYWRLRGENSSNNCEPVSEWSNTFTFELTLQCPLPPAPPAKMGDINRDGVVDRADYDILLSEFDAETKRCPGERASDLDFNGYVDIFDYNRLLGAWSNEPYLPTTPAAPQNLRAGESTLTSFSFAWDDASDRELGYQIYKWNGGEFLAYETLPANSQNFTVHNVECGVAEYFKVAAFNEAGVSALIGHIEVKTLPCPPEGTPDLCPEKTTNFAAFFEHWKCYGLQFNVMGVEEFPTLPTGYNNAFSSVKVAEGHSVLVFEKPNFAGTSRCLNHSIADFYYSGEKYDDGVTSLSDSISSYKSFADESCGISAPSGIQLFLPLIQR